MLRSVHLTDLMVVLEADPPAVQQQLRTRVRESYMARHKSVEWVERYQRFARAIAEQSSTPAAVVRTDRPFKDTVHEVATILTQGP